jgi:hypothetical protein
MVTAPSGQLRAQHEALRRVALIMRALLLLLVATPAYADGWWETSNSGPLQNVLDRNDCDHCAPRELPKRRDFRIIDVDEMKARDCALARNQNRDCMIDWPIEYDCLDSYVPPVPKKYRYELVRQILDSAEDAD